MSYDLRREPFIRFRRRGGTLEWGPISAIVKGLDGDDPIVAIATPRADFDATITEFLIGLLTAALEPRDESAWRERWNVPPSEAELQAALEALPNAFDLDGDGPRFMQDLSAADLAPQEVEPIQDLLLNAKNSGLFIKPGVVKVMGRPAAAMALLTMQTYSTAGGRGYRTSLRGGGPLTTLVDPRALGAPEVPLWHLLWANVETEAQLNGKHRRGGESAPSRLFPWLAATRTSAKNETTEPDDVHALQAYFGMTRRIRLEFVETNGVCDVTGLPDEHMVTGFRGKSSGTNYMGWLHPLSPYYEGKIANEKLPMHPQPGGIGWRDWLSLMHGRPATGAQAAATVTHFRTYRAGRLKLSSYSVRAFGYDASNAKLRAWISCTLPEFADMEPERISKLTSTMRRLIDATDVAAFLLKSAVASASFAHSDDVKGDPSGVRTSLWHAMENEAYSCLENLAAATLSDDAILLLSENFRRRLAKTATRLFDEHAPTDSTDPDVLRRLIKARWSLVTALAGHGKFGEKLFVSLDLVAPGVKKKQDNAKSPKKNKTTGVTS